MVDLTPTQGLLNDQLTCLLTAAGCWGGHLQARFSGGAALASITGHHASGKDVLVHPIERPLKRLLSRYAEETPGELGLLTIDVDLPRAIFRYECLSAAAQDMADAQAADDAAKTQAQQQQQHRQYLRKHLSAEPYGPELASQVAEALAQGRSFNYRHRDYCGQGFDVQRGHYRYGEVWDGNLLEPTHTFGHRPEFVAWLARQSDRALAQLESNEPWAWNNQPVTRARLLDLVQGLASAGPTHPE